MKKLLILLSIIFLMSGCYDYVEIDDLVIVTGMLIDYNDNLLKSSMEHSPMLMISSSKSQIIVVFPLISIKRKNSHIGNNVL